jgi:hypothetical protein
MVYSTDTSSVDDTRDYLTKCTFEICGLGSAYFEYRPNRAANLTFAVLFGISMLAFLAQGIYSKKWLGFTIAMVTGCVLEVMGYAGRFVAYEELYTEVCCGRNVIERKED